MNKNSLIIGISGGTGSGKTKFAKELISRCDPNDFIYISQDSYYKDLSHLSYDDRCNVNFDCPDSIDFKVLHEDLKSLLNNNNVNIPIYNYKRHKRLEESIELKPKPIIILEGIFSLYKSEIRELLDYKIFIDTPADIRILRRAKRDVNKRGRSMESIFSQYVKTVRPMHKKFVEPTKTYADIIVMDGGKNKMALDIINNKLLPIIKDTIDAHS